MVMKYFNLEDSDKPGIVKVEVVSVKKNMPVSVVKVVEIIRKSEFRPTRIGQKYTVANRLLRDNL